MGNKEGAKKMPDRLPMKTRKYDARQLFNRPITTTHNGLEKLYTLITKKIKLPR